MKNKLKWVFGFLFCIGFIGLYVLYSSFNGSILKKISMTYHVKQYIEENYANQDLEVEFCRYDFKMMGYYCKVQSSQSQDTYFSVWKEKDTYVDNYESSVLGKENTFSRLCMELDAYVEDCFKDYPYRTTLILCTPQEKNIEKLELDMPFDPHSFPFSATLSIWTETKNEYPSIQEMKERLIELDAFIHDKMPNIDTYEIRLQAPYIEEDGELKTIDFEHEISLYQVPRDIIVSNQLDIYLQQNISEF